MPPALQIGNSPQPLECGAQRFRLIGGGYIAQTASRSHLDPAWIATSAAIEVADVKEMQLHG
jgi:hypothetical protein